MVEIKRGWIVITHTCGHITKVPDNGFNTEYAERVSQKTCGNIACKVASTEEVRR